ncbi:hypothetical protein BC831DRAFT_440324 [Entophlyctis helioformis]|nr:hypothetical protein BC831DRAFT_440324 [Entophlyctis helioformis]
MAFDRNDDFTDESDAGGAGFNSDDEEVELRQAKGRRPAKKTAKVTDGSESDASYDNVNGNVNDNDNIGDDDQEESGEEDDEEDDDGEDDDDEDDEDLNTVERGNAKPLTLATLKKFQDKVDSTGVVYLSRVPPFMKPQKVRSLLSRYGELGRIYLNPEDAKVAARRRKYKHNKRTNYTEGWVEFLDKGVARRTAELLNNSTIGGKKRSFYYDDIWNIKYLPRFKWNHLTEQLAYELKVKEQRLRTEMSQAKRENKMYLGNVAKAKMIEAIQERRTSKKRERDDEDGGDAKAAASASSASAAAAAGSADAASSIRRTFKQRRVVDVEQSNPSAAPSKTTKPSSSSSASSAPAAKTKKSSMLSKIFS